MSGQEANVSSNVLGIDPGLTGGLALLPFPPAGDWGSLRVMPTIGNALDIPALDQILGDWAEWIARAYLEQVHAMPKQGVSSSFKFGRVYGVCEALLERGELPADA